MIFRLLKWMWEAASNDSIRILWIQLKGLVDLLRHQEQPVLGILDIQHLRLLLMELLTSNSSCLGILSDLQRHQIENLVDLLEHLAAPLLYGDRRQLLSPIYLIQGPTDAVLEDLRLKSLPLMQTNVEPFEGTERPVILILLPLLPYHFVEPLPDPMLLQLSGLWRAARARDIAVGAYGCGGAAAPVIIEFATVDGCGGGRVDDASINCEVAVEGAGILNGSRVDGVRSSINAARVTFVIPASCLLDSLTSVLALVLRSELTVVLGGDLTSIFG